MEDNYYEEYHTEKSSARGLMEEEILSFRARHDSTTDQRYELKGDKTPRKNMIKPLRVITNDTESAEKLVEPSDSKLMNSSRSREIHSPINHDESPKIKRKTYGGDVLGKNLVPFHKKQTKSKTINSINSPTKWSVDRALMGGESTDNNILKRIKNIFSTTQNNKIGSPQAKSDTSQVFGTEQELGRASESLEKKIADDDEKTKKRKEIVNAVIKLIKEREKEYNEEEGPHPKGERMQRLEDIIEFDEKYLDMKPYYPLVLREMTDLEKINFYEDDLPLLAFRKKIYSFSKNVSALSYRVLKSTLFEWFTLTIIGLNSVLLALDDPTDNQSNSFKDFMETFFLSVYTIEMMVKVTGLGFVLNKGAYLRDAWNILDFLILIFAYIPYFLPNSSINLTVLRSFRVLRPLRTISNIKNLKLLLSALFEALPLLKDAMIILIFFYTIFAIAGLQLFAGLFKYSCFEASTGKMIDGTVCGSDYQCGSDNLCGKGFNNPNWGITNFDSFPSAFLQVFQCVTMEGWSDTLYYVEITFSEIFVVYFLFLILIGAFFLMNLTLAIIKVKFSEAKEKSSEGDNGGKEGEKFQLDKLRRLRIYKRGEVKMFFYKYKIKSLCKCKRKKKSQIFKKETVENESPFRIPWLRGSLRTAEIFQKSLEADKKNNESVVKSLNNNETEPQFFSKEKVIIEKRASISHKRKTSILLHAINNLDERGLPKTAAPIIRSEQFMKSGSRNSISNPSEKPPARRGSVYDRIGGGPTNIPVISTLKRKGSQQVLGVIGRKNSVINFDKATKINGSFIQGLSLNPSLVNQSQSQNQQLGISKKLNTKGALIKNSYIIKNPDSSIVHPLILLMKKPIMKFSKVVPVNSVITQGEDPKPKLDKSIDIELNCANINNWVLTEEDRESSDKTESIQKTILRKSGEISPEHRSVANNFSILELRSKSKNSKKTVKFQKITNIQSQSAQQMVTQSMGLAREQIADLKNVRKYKTKREQEFFEKSSSSFKITSASLNSVFEEKYQVEQKDAPQQLTGESSHLDEELLEYYQEDKEFNKMYPLNKKKQRKENREESATHQKKHKTTIKKLKSDNEIELQPSNDMRHLRRGSHKKTTHMRKNEDTDNSEDRGMNHDLTKRIKKIYARKETIMEDEEICGDDILLRERLKNIFLIPHIIDDLMIYSSSDEVLASREEEKKRLKEEQNMKLLRECKKKITYTLKFNEGIVVKLYHKHIQESNGEFATNNLTISGHPLARYATDLDKYRNRIPLQSGLLYKDRMVEKQSYLMSVTMAQREKDAIVDPVLPEFGLKSTILQKIQRKKNLKAEENNINWTVEKAMEMIFTREDDEERKLNVEVTEKDAVAKMKEIVEKSKGQQKQRAVRKIEDYKEKYNELLLQDIQYNGKNMKTEWSGEDVFGVTKAFHKRFMSMRLLKKFKFLVKGLNYQTFDWDIWAHELEGHIRIFRRKVKHFIFSNLSENLIMLCVIANTLILALDGLVDDDTETNLFPKFNLLFTIIFTLEVCFKVTGIGFTSYLRDKMSIFDLTVVILSLVEIFFLDSSSFSAFRSVRIFRTFRVLRVTRLIRSLDYMIVIINVLGNSIQDFFYISLLLLLFIYIYTLLGMQIYGGTFHFGIDDVRNNFDSFGNSFLTVFQIMTLENWQTVMFLCIRCGIPIIVSMFFLISWIFIGNYILLNLFLAILLDGFAKEREEKEIELELDDDEEERPEQYSFKPFETKKSFFGSNTDLMKKASISETNYPSANNIGGPSTNVGTSLLSSNIMKSRNNFYRSLKSLFPRLKISKTISCEPSNIAKDLPREVDEDALSDTSPMKDPRKKVKVFHYYQGNFPEKSLYLFAKENLFRKACYRIVKSTHFDNFILILIVFSSFKLVFDTYVDDKAFNDNDQIALISLNIDYFFNVCFILEALLKIIAYGFSTHPNSYIREWWNVLDFFIVCASLLDMSIDAVNIDFIKILRLLRILRPLRFISHNRNMKVVISALIESIGGIINVVIVMMLIWMMFAIMGMNFMSGRMGYCDEPPGYGISEAQCLSANKIWKKYPTNFDNIFYSMMTLFILCTLEDWPVIMYLFVDGNDPEYGPARNESPLLIIFFLFFVLIGSLFLMNLFIGVIFMQYLQAENRERNKYLTEDQLRWIDIQRLVVKENPDYFSLKPPDFIIQKIMFKIINTKFFETLIIIAIVLNIITMALIYDDAPTSYESILSNLNLAFTLIFIFEACVKIIAVGFRGYFYSFWNRFDFFVVVTSILDLIMENTGNSLNSVFKIGPQIARVLRVLRVSRILRLIKRFEGLQKVIQTSIYSLPSLLNVFALLCLFFFIFSILSVFLFRNIRTGRILNDYVNFSNFGQALLTLFRCSTGEGWYIIMFDTMNSPEGSTINVFFFIAFIVVCQSVMLNLFILIILQKFEENYINPDNPLENYNDDVQKFKRTWVSFTLKEHGMRLHQKKLVDFFMQTPKPLGIGWDEEAEKVKDEKDLELLRITLKKQCAKSIMKMNLVCDTEGNVYFNELLFASMKQAYYTQVYEQKKKGTKTDIESTKKHNTAMAMINKEEYQTFKKLDKLKKNIMSNKKRAALFTNTGQTINPILNILFVGMTFRSWIRFKERFYNRLIQVDKSVSTISLSSEEDDEDEEIYEEVMGDTERVQLEEESLSSHSEPESGDSREQYQEEDYSDDNEDDEGNKDGKELQYSSKEEDVNFQEEYSPKSDLHLQSKQKGMKRPSFQEIGRSEISGLSANKKVIAEEEDRFDDDDDKHILLGPIGTNNFNELPNMAYYEGRNSEARLSDGRFGVKKKKEGSNSSSNNPSNNPSPSHVQNITNIINYNIKQNVIINNNFYISPAGFQTRSNNASYTLGEKEPSNVDLND